MPDFKAHKISSPLGLRLDNLVYNRHGEVHSIRINDFHAFDHPDMGGNYGLYGIPLTEEIIASAGFGIRRDFWVWQPEWKNIEYRLIYSTSSWFLSRGFLSWDDSLREVEFIHQVQNIIYSLEDIELTINL